VYIQDYKETGFTFITMSKIDNSLREKEREKRGGIWHIKLRRERKIQRPLSL
jgi:hypothetical protein